MKIPKKKSYEFHQRHSQKQMKNLQFEQKIQIVMEAVRAEMSITELCRKYSINESQFYKWNKEFLEAEIK